MKDVPMKSKKLKMRNLHSSETLGWSCLFLISVNGSLFIINRYIESYRQGLYECRCDERLKTKPEESTRLVYTGLLVELEHLKIKTT